MRLRFWEPEPDPISLNGPDHVWETMPARRMNLTELERFGQAMAQALDEPEGALKVLGSRLGEGNVNEEVPIELADLDEKLPEQRAFVNLRVMGRDRTLPGGGSFTPSLTLQLGDGEGQPALLHGSGPRSVADLLRLWNRLGRPRRTWSWIYPTAFLFAVAGALAPLVVLWIREQLTLWLIPAAVALVALAFATMSPVIQARVKRHRAARAGLDLDYRRLRAVRTASELRRLEWQSGLVGAGIAAAIAAVGIWATLRAGG